MQVRAIGRRIPGVQVSGNVPSPLGGGGGFGGGGTASVSVQIAGPDLTHAEPDLRPGDRHDGTIPGLQDVQNSSNAGNPELHIQLDRARMAQLNVTSQSVRRPCAPRSAARWSPRSASRRDPARHHPDRVRRRPPQSGQPVGRSRSAPAPHDGAVRRAAAATATSTTPTIVTLGQVATISYGTGPVQIQRVDRNRTMTISGTAVRSTARRRRQRRDQGDEPDLAARPATATSCAAASSSSTTRSPRSARR